MNQIPNIEETYNTREVEEILKQVESEYEMGGLSDGLYGDYAKEVAIRYAHQELQKARQNWLREEIVRLEGIEDNKLYGFPVIVSDDPHPSEDYKEGFLIGFNLACTSIIDRYKTELNNNQL